MKILTTLGVLVSCSASLAETRTVFLEANDGQRVEVATLEVEDDGTYAVNMSENSFTDHFLSMRPFKCLEGPVKNWCHVPYPYEIRRDLSEDLTDLEYDFLFVWKGAADYGINMWNGVYYQIEPDGAGMKGVLHEMDMDVLSAPPAQGELRPVLQVDLLVEHQDGIDEPDLTSELAALEHCMEQISEASRKLVLAPYRGHGVLTQLAAASGRSRNSVYKQIRRIRRRDSRRATDASTGNRTCTG